mmetsp:Transcript_29848/g.72125  ORF Transcript_29848/g.72125 Transcript_29848/m.72125 type:complete len:185 (-) Transcript_29848:2-556(-)
MVPRSSMTLTMTTFLSHWRITSQSLRHSFIERMLDLTRPHFFTLLSPESSQKIVPPSIRMNLWEQVTNILGRGVSPLTPPIVKHERTDHDYLADFEAEHNLYGKTTALLKFLDGWTSAAKTLPEKLSDLWIALYEHDFIGLLDVEAMEEWIKFLLGIGYEFPIPNTDESLISDWRRVVSSLALC